MEFIRFSVVGTSGVVVNLVAYYALTRTFALPLQAAALVAIEISVLWNFWLNDTWTFARRPTDAGRLARVARFHAVSVAGGAINYAMLLVLTTAGWWDISANLCGIAAGAVAKFTINSAWTWREPDGSLTRMPLTLPRGGAR